MKTLTIIPDDNIVVVDGVGFKVEKEISLDSDVHAMQWDAVEEKGSIEFKSNKDNQLINSEDIKPFLVYIEDHKASKDKLDKFIADEEAVNTKRVSDQAAYEALPTTKRKRAFKKELSIGDQLDEILKFIAKQGGRTPEMDVILAKSKEIKDRFPKEGE